MKHTLYYQGSVKQPVIEFDTVKHISVEERPTMDHEGKIVHVTLSDDHTSVRLDLRMEKGSKSFLNTIGQVIQYTECILDKDRDYVINSGVSLVKPE